MIWHKKFELKNWEGRDKGTIHESLGIELTEIGEDFISGKMPIDKRTFQPAGILHGGASVVLAESLGSIASNLVIDDEKQFCVGQSINANHIRPGIKGYAYGKATPIHIGKKTHLWEIKITNEQDKLICISRLTMAILDK